MLIESSNGYVIRLIDEFGYDPDSVDNVNSYKKFYSAGNYNDYLNSSKHGIHIFDGEGLLNSACICAFGGKTGIHPNCLILEAHQILACCADSVFCLTIPDLNLSWVTKADTATCFEIFKHEDDFIVHGELEITRLNKNGKIIWEFSGSDIFTTPTGRNDFKLEGSRIEAINWEGIKFVIDAPTGNVVVQI